MVVCAIEGMQQQKSAQQILFRKPFADVRIFRKCVGATLVLVTLNALVKFCRNLFSRRPIWRKPPLLLSVLHEQDFVSKSTAGGRRQLQSQRAMKGMTVRRATIAALGRTTQATQISIHIQPPSLPRTRLDRAYFLVPSSPVSDKRF